MPNNGEPHQSTHKPSNHQEKNHHREKKKKHNLKLHSSSRAPFVFPSTHHLLITTPRCIYSLDDHGLHHLFASSKHGILAAKEAKDTSQILAVASQHTVILHDCARGRQHSWGLEESNTSDPSQIRLLEYTPDAKKLLLSTSLTGAIQCYSIHGGNAQQVGKEHPSPPTVMALSPDGRVMISASESPTVVFVLDLKRGESARQLHPRAGQGAVVVAAFHPERAKVFLLGFKDGSLAAYDLNGWQEGGEGNVDLREARQDLDRVVKEIGRFTRLHRMTNRGVVDSANGYDAALLSGWDDGTRTSAVGAKSLSITGAAFLPGYRSRAVSVGGDGRCRLVEFEGGGSVVRTWDASPNLIEAPFPAAVTGVSVLGVRELERQKRQGSMSKGKLSHIIAVGRVDGLVLLFDSLGLELKTVSPEDSYDRIISVEWVSGASPKALPFRSVGSMVHREGTQRKSVCVEKQKNDNILVRDCPSTAKGKELTLGHSLALKKPDLHPERVLVKACQGMSLGLPSALKKPNLHLERIPVPNLIEHHMSGAIPPEDFNTVRRMPGVANSPHVRFEQGTRIDLFSSNQPAPPLTKLSPRTPAGIIDTSRVSRPRLSSKTFIRNHGAAEGPAKAGKKPAPSHADFSTATEQHSPMIPNAHALEYLDIPEPPRFRPPKRYLDVSNTRSSSTESVLGISDTDTGQSFDRQTRSEAATGTPRRNSNFALFAPYMNRTATSGLIRTGHNQALPAIAVLPPNGTKKAQPRLETRVSGPMGMTISVDGVNSTITSPEIHPNDVPTVSMSEETISSGGNVWNTATSSDSEGLSPGERRSRVRARLQESIQRPLARMDFRATDDNVSSSTSTEPSTSQDVVQENLAATRTHTEHEQSSSHPPLFSPGRRPTLYPAHPPTFPTHSPHKRLCQQAQAMLGDPKEAMHTSTSYITTDGTFYPDSEDIRSLYPRTSSLSPKRSTHRKYKHDRKLERAQRSRRPHQRSSHHDRSSSSNPSTKYLPSNPTYSYARLHQAEMNNRAFDDCQAGRRNSKMPSALPPPIPLKHKRRMMPEQIQANTVECVNHVDIGAKNASVEKATTRAKRREDYKRHKEATKAAWALLGKKPLPLERELSLIVKSEPFLRGGQSAEGYFQEEEEEEEEEEEAELDTMAETENDDKDEMLMVYPGIGTVDRKFVERVSTKIDNSNGRLEDKESRARVKERETGEPRTEKEEKKKERCKNCRILLKTKRELQEEVHILQREVVRLEQKKGGGGGGGGKGVGNS